MAKLEKLTKEQEELMLTIRDKWMDFIFSCKNTEIDKEKCIEGVNFIYKLSGKKSPEILFVDSPMGMQYAYHLINNLNSDKMGASMRDSVKDSVRTSVRTSVKDSLGDSVWNSVGNSVRASVEDSVGDSVWNSVRDSVRDSVEDSVGDSVWNSVKVSVWASVGNSVRDSVRDSELNYQQVGDFGNIGDFGWVAYYEYFTQIGVLNNKKFNQFQSLIESGVYDMLQYENLCIVCPLPVYISRNSEGRLHSLDNSAIRWKDDYEQHYIQGVFITPILFDKLSKEQYSFNDFIKEENEEIKAACMFFIREKFGESALYRFFEQNLKEENTYTHKKDESLLIGTTGSMKIGVYTLFKGKFGEIEIAYVRCYCPSTDRMFYLGVEPTFTNAKDAIASLYRVPRVLKPYIKEIRRQGERFSTTFNEKGLILLDSLSKENAEDLVSISGNDYFKQLTYEF